MISVTNTTPHTPLASVAAKLAAARLARFISYGFLISLLLFGALLATNAHAQTPTTIEYQAHLIDVDTPPDGLYGIELTIYDAQTGGTPQAPVVHLDNVRLQDGVFDVRFDVGSAPFAASAARFVEIAYRAAGSGDAYLPLNRRHPFTAVPYALRTVSAETAQTADTANTATRATTATIALDSEKLGGVAAAQYVLGNDSRLSDARTPTAGSVNYIQNRLTPQLGSSFYITGNGTVGGALSGNVVNAVTSYNIDGNRVLGVAGTGNAFVGRNAGAVNTTGGNNSFVGRDAGFFNTTGSGNSLFGALAGNSNSIGNDNSFFGRSAGAANTTASGNAFFGSLAGAANTTGNGNSFFGASAGVVTTTGTNNSFFGRLAGMVNTTGFSNTFVGGSAGEANTTGTKNTFVGSKTGVVNSTGDYNSFFGYHAGNSNITGSYNTLVGAGAVIGQSISHATAVGADSYVATSNTVALGRLGGADTVVAYGNAKIEGIVGVGGLKLESFPPISLIAHATLCVDRKTRIVGTCPYIEPEPILRAGNAAQAANTEYDRTGVALVASVRAQQERIERQAAQLDSQQEELARQRTTIDLLRQLVCAQNPQAGVCNIK